MKKRNMRSHWKAKFGVTGGQANDTGKIRSLGEFAQRLSQGLAAVAGRDWMGRAQRVASKYGKGCRPRGLAEMVMLRSARFRGGSTRVLQIRPQIFLNFAQSMLQSGGAANDPRTGTGKVATGSARTALPNTSGIAHPFAFSRGRNVSGQGRIALTGDGVRQDAALAFKPQRMIAPTLERADLLVQRCASRASASRRTVFQESEVSPIVLLSRRILRATERHNLPQFVPQVYLSRARPQNAPQESPRAVEETIEMRRFNEVARQVSSPTGLPANVAQITEHVINQLDRRMVAWRERMGKV
jgi:hypothetical protein